MLFNVAGKDGAYKDGGCIVKQTNVARQDYPKGHPEWAALMSACSSFSH